jgi:multicomponent K+:H+ antiporter subunit D
VNPLVIAPVLLPLLAGTLLLLLRGTLSLRVRRGLNLTLVAIQMGVALQKCHDERY